MNPANHDFRLRTIARVLVVLGMVSSVVSIAGLHSRAGAAGNDEIAKAPRNNVAAIYNSFGAGPYDSETLATIADDLTGEGYQVKQYADVNEGNGSRGGATLANFAKMAKTASVIVINGHGYDPAAATQECLGGKGFVGFEAPAVAPVPAARSCAALPAPVVQVEWYPTLEAGDQARRDYVKQGYKDDWFFGPEMVGTNIPTRRGDFQVLGDDGNPVKELGGHRAALFLTASGVAHFFAKQKPAIVDVMACQSMALAPSFNARTYFGHERTGCTGKQTLDEPKLFDRMTGHSGVEARATTKAFEMGGFSDQYFQMADTSKPVVLSPAVAEFAPSDGGGIDGTNTPGRIKFDATMANTDAKRVVTASGCDATVANAKWDGGDALSFNLRVPKTQPGKTITLTVHQNAARSATSYPHALDGNQNPSASGVAPNRDDYVAQLSCAPSKKYKMVYTGTYDETYSQTGPYQAPDTETASYQWTQTQIVRLSAPGPYTSETDSTTTLAASGTLKRDRSGGLQISCAIQTPQDYQWVTKRTGGKLASNTPVSFSWSIDSPPMPGSPGVTGSASNGAPSGCESSESGFTPGFGIPQSSSGLVDVTAIDSTQTQALQDAGSGTVSFTPDKLPQTKHFDVDGSGTRNDGGTSTTTAKLSFHGTLTFTKVP